MAIPNSRSRYTLQAILDKVQPLGDINPILGQVSHAQLEPFITICTDVMTEIFAQPFPYKWAEILLPIFYSNSLQQDYVLTNPDGSSFFTVEWLTRGIVVQMTGNTLPKPWGYVECGRQLTQGTGTVTQIGLWNNPTFEAALILNKLAYFGTWGASLNSQSLGNDPGVGSIYSGPLTNNGTMTNNPITQIRDSNGNLLVIQLLQGQPYNSATVTGVCGTVPPTAPLNAAPGTQVQDGQVTWVVVDPNGWAVRLLPIPSATGVVFQFNLVGQQTSVPPYTNLSQTIDPLPDKYEPYFRQGVIAQCYRHATDPKVFAKFERAYMLWVQSLRNLRELQDRELEENRFTPERGIMGGRRNWYVGAAWPFQYPN